MCQLSGQFMIFVAGSCALVMLTLAPQLQRYSMMVTPFIALRSSS
jgi:hypothetical protein